MASASAESVLRNYFHAKDENRPHLLDHVFTPDAELEVLNHTEAIAFPARTIGRDAIAEVLVRRFGQTHENVYSFYLQRPSPLAATFSCSWLVAMSDKDSREVRVGCGRYQWAFADEEPRLAARLTITIRAMQILHPTTLPAVLAWLAKLTYPWSSIAEVRRFAPALELLAPVLQELARHEVESPAAPHPHLGQANDFHPRKDSNMDQKPVSDTWERGNPYEQYVGRWSRQVAPLFLSWLGVPAGRRWLDVGCGTGALCAAIADRCSPSWVAGVEPSAGFLETAKANLSERVALHQGSATAIPLADASVDVVASALVLNFVPDPQAALAEMARVAGKDGTIAAYVWDYAGRMELMRFFWDAAVALDPGAAKLDEGLRFPLCRPEALEQLYRDAGLRGVEVKAIDIPTPFASFDDYWQPFLGGQGPAPAYAMSLDEAARGRLRDRIRERLPMRPDGSVSLTARAWAVRGSVAQ